MALKFLGSTGSGYTKDAISCIQYALNNGAHIMSNSWGGASNDSLEQAIEAAGDAGLLFVAAAGNESKNNDVNPSYPASYDCNNIIAVLATEHNDVLSSFSNYGATSVDLGAPGSSIMSTSTYGAYLNLSGTSMACPHVAAACALIWSINPTLGWSEVKDIALESVDKLDSLDGKCVSEGRLNLHRAILKIPKSEGFVTLDRQHYSCSDQIRITAGDSDLSGNGTLDVNVVTTDGNDLETVTLTETPADSGLFIGVIATCPNSVSPGNGYLEVADGQTITVTYDDANDVAAADCTAPVISDVQVSSIWSVGGNIAFQTDEVAFARITCATDVNGPFDNIGEGPEMQSHFLGVGGLNPETAYYFKVEAFDAAGNLTTDANDDYSVTTTASIVVPTDYASIQDAIDAARPLETIVIEPNTYCQTFKFNGKPVTVTGTDPLNWDVVEATIIDANRAFKAVFFDCSPCVTPAVVRGLTVRNAAYAFAGTIGLQGPFVYNCVVEGCLTTGFGAFTGAGHIANNIVRGNAIGIGMVGGTIQEGNLIYDNTYGIKGSLAQVNPVINNTIVRNSVGIYDTTPTFGEPIMKNCIVWGNDVNDLVLGQGAPTYCCLSDPNDLGDPNLHNICVDPCLVNIYEFGDVTAGSGTTTSIVVTDASKYDVNDVIEYANDAVPRTVTDVNETTDIVTFNPALDANSISGDRIRNWGFGVTDVNEDLHLAAASLCADAGDPNGDYRDTLDIDGTCRNVNGVDIGADEICLPSTYSTYSDWVYFDRPSCWCQCYQCDGDADGATETAAGYRIYDADLALITANWKKTKNDYPASLDPCADIDHKYENPLVKWRVSASDLSIVITNWKKTDPNLPANCPRAE